MSLPLKDCRTSIPESVDVWLEIEAASTGHDKTVIVRDVLKAWAKAKQHAYTVATRKLQANGLQPELFGDEPVDNGTSRKTSAAAGGRKP
jgi:hypothetical protein